MSQIHTGLPVYPLLEEIFRDNHDDGVTISAVDLKSFISVANTSQRSSSFLDCLSKLCVCKGKGIVVNQDIICRCLLKQNASYFFQTRVSESDGSLLISKDGTLFNRLDRFLWEADRVDFNFFHSSLCLFSSLCYGRNTTSIEEVRKFVSDTDARTGLMCSQLPYALRSAYCDILHHVYLDCPPNRLLIIETVHATSLPHSQAISNAVDERGERDFGSEIVSDFDSRLSGKDVDRPDSRYALTSFRSFRGNSLFWEVIVQYLIAYVRDYQHPSSIANEFFLSYLRLLRSVLSFDAYPFPRNPVLFHLLTKALSIYLDDTLVPDSVPLSNDPFVSASVPVDLSLLIEIKVEICLILEKSLFHSLRSRLMALVAKCMRFGDYVKVIQNQIDFNRQMIVNAMRNENLERVLVAVLGHRDARLSGFAMRLLVCNRSRQIAAFEEIANSMTFLHDKEVELYETVTAKCDPEITHACDSLFYSDISKVRDAIQTLTEMCGFDVHHLENRPDIANQNHLAHLRVHNLVVRLLTSMPSALTDAIATKVHSNESPAAKGIAGTVAPFLDFTLTDSR
jgi:hypothetical protein